MENFIDIMFGVAAGIILAELIIMHVFGDGK